ncbi:MAG: hypothetical protein QW478_01425 [Candidatus Micrarchaeaceae archaeon]
MSSDETLQKLAKQLEKKREYNKKYYHNNVKPKREQEKKELEELRKIKNNGPPPDKSVDKVKEKLYSIYGNLSDDELIEKIEYDRELIKENEALKIALNNARTNNYKLMVQISELMIQKNNISSHLI